MAWIMFSCMCFFLFYKVQKKWQRVVLALGFSGAAVLACTYKRNFLIYVVVFEDVHESMIYGILFLACCFLLRTKRKKGSIRFCYMLPAVTFIGGFLCAQKEV